MKSEELYYVTFEVKKLPCNKLGPGYYKFGKTGIFVLMLSSKKSFNSKTHSDQINQHITCNLYNAYSLGKLA